MSILSFFRFYEEIGAGRFSTVYKGRVKRSVEFVAIRRVEKASQAKVSTEVQAMHSLDHANVLKFHAWFATPNHLWVVTEYCAGGDLRALLAQDGSLPEETVLSFGLDVLAALQCIHQRGRILLVDLRPSTLLISEYGIVKIADFGCACPIESPHGIDGTASEAHDRLTAMARTSPSYIAPELLASAGRHTVRTHRHPNPTRKASPRHSRIARMCAHACARPHVRTRVRARACLLPSAHPPSPPQPSAFAPPLFAGRL